MKWLATYILIILLSLTACSLLGNNDDESRPDIPGKIVLSAKDATGTPQIYTMNANGSDINQLTNYGPEHAATQPAWSPDGQRIIFSSTERGTSAGPALWVMDADGDNRRLLYDPEPNNPHVPPLAGSNARWSPDGSKVALDFCLNCQVGTNNEIYLFDTATKAVTKLTDHPASDRNPTWSSDGERIAFVSNRDFPEEHGTDIYSIEINEKKVTRLTQTGNAGRQLWYANGKKLIYWSENNLYKLNLVDMQSQLISVDVQEETGFRPLALFPDEENILLQVFNYQNPNQEESLQVFDLSEKKLTPVYTNEAFNGADWFIPK